MRTYIGIIPQYRPLHESGLLAIEAEHYRKIMGACPSIPHQNLGSFESDFGPGFLSRRLFQILKREPRTECFATDLIYPEYFPEEWSLKPTESVLLQTQAGFQYVTPFTPNPNEDYAFAATILFPLVSANTEGTFFERIPDAKNKSIKEVVEQSIKQVM